MKQVSIVGQMRVSPDQKCIGRAQCTYVHDLLIWHPSSRYRSTPAFLHCMNKYCNVLLYWIKIMFVSIIYIIVLQYNYNNNHNNNNQIFLFGIT